MLFELPTSGIELELHLTLEARVPCVLNIKGLDATRKDTVYFNRGYGCRLPGIPLFTGTRTLLIPMPLSPQMLTLSVSNDVGFDNVRLVKADAQPLKKKKIKLTDEQKDFISFAYDFARDAGTIDTDTYVSDYENFIVRYLPVLKNRDTGKNLSTPARVNRRTGIKEVAREKFIKYTVFMRIIILFHEFFHWFWDTRSERAADRGAIDWALSLGFPETEVMYAFTKVFPSGNKALTKREKDNIDYINNWRTIQNLNQDAIKF